LTIDFGKPTTFNRFLAQEYIRLGQRVKAFTVEALVDGNWKELAKATTIGYKRILRFPTVEATQLRFSITDSKSCPVISNIGIYNAPQILTSPTIIRNQSGEITIKDIPEGDYLLEIYQVGYRVNDPYATYLDLKRPDQLTRQEVNAIKKINDGSPISHKMITISSGQAFSQLLDIRENDVFLLKITALQ
jgi:hypothetical protein